MIADTGLSYVRYSLLKKTNDKRSDRPPVILGDTMGDLRKFYSLASVVFVGRSLVPMGGSDMMEAAALGKCTIFGPYTFNFRQTVESLLASNGAIVVNNGDELLAAMQKCLLEPDYARQIARNGQDDIKRNQGATAKSIEQIEKLLITA
jgi:3-deoxy-D-manno-octulosonic-acid transferase